MSLIFWQSGTRQWRVRVKRAWSRFLMQENMTNSLFSLHKTFFKVFEQHGGAFLPSPFSASDHARQEFQCHCGKSFSSQQGLACHQRQKHQQFAPEHKFLVGETCPACLKFFWTKQRLYLHLAYVSRRTGPNRCFQQLSQQGFQDLPNGQYFQVKPLEVRGLARVETVQGARTTFACR